MSKRPNILFLMADQMQARVLEDDHVCDTPCLDRLAAEGIRFTRAYTPNNICSPTRASIMTGLLPHNHGVLEVLYPQESHMHQLLPDKEHFARRLSEVGYSTGYFGKWHVEGTNDLQRFGWQVDGGLLSKIHRDLVKGLGSDTQAQAKLDPAVHITEPAGYGPHPFCGVTNTAAEMRPMGLSTTLALRYLENAVKQEDPWCCFLSFQEPHDPYITERSVYEHYANIDIPPPPHADDPLTDRPGLYRRAQGIWKQLSEKDKREARTCYFGSITEVDTQFQRVVDFLERTGVLDDTIVISMSDHGDLLGAHGLFFKDISAFEEIFNVPFIVRGPGVSRGALCEGRVGLHDLCPTVLELAGCEPIEESDARSFVELLDTPDQAGDKWRGGYAEYYGNRHRLTQKVVWDGAWKFVFNGFDFDELYNLEDDPLEMVNLAPDPEYREQLVKMTQLFWQYARDTNDTPLVGTLYPALRLAEVGPLADEW
ncbi:MAG: sulfatase-like hydrolase/transferase [Candidatus Latescibacteria bacterium]|nr:sulfatase-like hydrolase/transferase [Candidatus Latescibacterota bacterium]